MKTLGDLRTGDKARIVAILPAPAQLTERLLEMGFLENSRVEVVHEAPFGSDPIAVRVRGALIALRRNEAAYVEVAYE